MSRQCPNKLIPFTLKIDHSLNANALPFQFPWKEKTFYKSHTSSVEPFSVYPCHISIHNMSQQLACKPSHGNIRNNFLFPFLSNPTPQSSTHHHYSLLHSVSLSVLQIQQKFRSIHSSDSSTVSTSSVLSSSKRSEWSEFNYDFGRGCLFFKSPKDRPKLTGLVPLPLWLRKCLLLDSCQNMRMFLRTTTFAKTTNRSLAPESWLALSPFTNWCLQSDELLRRTRSSANFIYIYVGGSYINIPSSLSWGGSSPAAVNAWFDSKGCPGQETLAHKHIIIDCQLHPTRQGIHVHHIIHVHHHPSVD